MLRTSIVLSVIAIGLLAYILIVERGTLSESDLESRKGSVIPELIRDRVQKIEIQRHGVTTVLERRHDEKDDLDYWVLTAPLEARADRDAVDALLGELEWMDARRRIGGLSEEDRKNFGFDTPRYRVWFTVGDQRFLVLVGKQSPHGQGTYLTLASRDTAFVVGKDLVETLDHPPEHYHTKELHDGVMAFSAVALALKHDGEELRLSRGDDGLWRIEHPTSALAETPDVHALVQAVDDLRASRFAAKAQTPEHGLERPELDLTIQNKVLSETEKDAQGKPKESREALRLRVGAPCEGHEGESFVRVDDGPVMCALDSDLAKLKKSQTELREERLLPIEQSEVSGVTLRAGDRVLSLTRKDDAFDYALERGDATLAEGQARQGAVAEWIKALGAQRAQSFTDRGPGELAEAAITLEVQRGKQPAFVVRADPRGAEGVVVRRADEPALAIFPAKAAQLLEPMAARFAPLQLVEREAEDLTALEIQHGDARQRIVREVDGFALEHPLEAPADRVLMGELSRTLSSLSALRFVADQQRNEHGLTQPMLTARIRFKTPSGGDEIELQVGAETEGGRYARLPDRDAVFVLADSIVDKLAQPLVSRNALSTPLEALSAAALEHAGKRLALTRKDETFVLDGEPSAGARQLANTLATLRAAAVTGYGPAQPEHGLDRPRATLAVTRRDGSSHELRIGERRDDATVHARRSDLAVGFALPATQVDALLAVVED